MTSRSPEPDEWDWTMIYALRLRHDLDVTGFFWELSRVQAKVRRMYYPYGNLREPQYERSPDDH